MFGPVAHHNLITDLSDFRGMSVVYLHVAIKACCVTHSIENAVTSLLSWRRQHLRQNLAFPRLSRGRAAPVPVQQGW